MTVVVQENKENNDCNCNSDYKCENCTFSEQLTILLKQQAPFITLLECFSSMITVRNNSNNKIHRILLQNIDMTVCELIDYYWRAYMAYLCIKTSVRDYNHKCCWYKNCKENKSIGVHIHVCNECYAARYCCKEHQIKDWNIRHKKHCDHIITIMMAVSNEVSIMVDKIDISKQCNVCGKESELLKYCAQCENVKYCSRKCQKIDWNINNHKQRCIKI